MSKIQNEDIKSLQELEAQGLTKANLPSSDKIYIPSLEKTLDDALSEDLATKDEVAMEQSRAMAAEESLAAALSEGLASETSRAIAAEESLAAAILEAGSGGSPLDAVLTVTESNTVQLNSVDLDTNGNKIKSNDNNYIQLNQDSIYINGNLDSEGNWVYLAAQYNDWERYSEIYFDDNSVTIDIDRGNAYQSLKMDFDPWQVFFQNQLGSSNVTPSLGASIQFKLGNYYVPTIAFGADTRATSAYVLPVGSAVDLVTNTIAIQQVYGYSAYAISLGDLSAAFYADNINDSELVMFKDVLGTNTVLPSPLQYGVFYHLIKDGQSFKIYDEFTNRIQLTSIGQANAGGGPTPALSNLSANGYVAVIRRPRFGASFYTPVYASSITAAESQLQFTSCDGMRFRNKAGPSTFKVENMALDMSSNKVVNLAAGVDPSDAINKSQLDEETSRAVSNLADAETSIRSDLSSLTIQVQGYQMLTVPATQVLTVSHPIVGQPWVQFMSIMLIPGLDFTFSGSEITLLGNVNPLSAGDQVHVYYMYETQPFA